MRQTKTYRFHLRGVHSLNSISEPTHGHGAFLTVSIESPVRNEAQFLENIKTHVLMGFDKKDWANALAKKTEPTGENVVLQIAQTIKTLNLNENFLAIELIETRKNKFRVAF